MEVMVEVDKLKERVCLLFFSSIFFGDSFDSGSSLGMWLFVKR